MFEKALTAIASLVSVTITVFSERATETVMLENLSECVEAGIKHVKFFQDWWGTQTDVLKSLSEEGKFQQTVNQTDKKVVKELADEWGAVEESLKSYAERVPLKVREIFRGQFFMHSPSFVN